MPDQRLSIRVLVIDDDPGMRAILRTFLEQCGHQTIEGASGEAALAAVERESVDVIVLDKEMPGMNGLDTLAALRRRRPETPVILVTAFGGPTVAEEAIRRGASHYLEKPFRVSALLDQLETMGLRAPRSHGR